jgi:hypothetical protein
VEVGPERLAGAAVVVIVEASSALVPVVILRRCARGLTATLTAGLTSTRAASHTARNRFSGDPTRSAAAAEGFRM